MRGPGRLRQTSRLPHQPLHQSPEGGMTPYLALEEGVPLQAYRSATEPAVRKRCFQVQGGDVTCLDVAEGPHLSLLEHDDAAVERDRLEDVREPRLAFPASLDVPPVEVVHSAFRILDEGPPPTQP